MRPELAQFAAQWNDKPNRQHAYATARAYINSHRSEIAPALESMSMEDIVQLVRGYRAAGREEDRIIADMWLITEYPQQHVTGSVNIGPSQPPLIDAIAKHLQGGG